MAIEDINSRVWAVFYEIETRKLFFTIRNSVPKRTLAEIEAESIVGLPIKLLI
jgi:hypothetical protein